MERDYFGNKKKKGRYDSFGYSDQFSREKYFSSRIGASTLLKREALDEVKSKIRSGAKNVEIVLSGIGKPSKARGNYPAGAYGATRRKDIKGLLDINKVRRSVHFSPGHSLVGLDREGNFNKRKHERVMGELEQSVDFAHDIGGENVVVHTSTEERPFPVEEEEGWEKFKGSKKMERKGRIYRFVDEETGKSFAISGDSRVPVWKKGKKYYPVRSEEEEEKEENGRPKDAHIEMVKARKAMDKGLTPKKLLISNLTAKQQKRANAEIQRFKAVEGEADHRIKDLETAIDLVKKYGDDLPKEANIPSDIRALLEKQLGYLPTEEKLKKLERQKTRAEYRNFWARNNRERYETQLKDIGRKKNKIKKADSYLKGKAKSSIARLAKKSYERYKETGKKVAITPENMMPEVYGGHPEELADLIRESRKEFVNDLKKEGVKKKKAEGLARDFIGATFDVAHANLWQKYYEGDKEEFNEWLKEKTEKLAEEEIAKEIHISDNFGFEDTHLAVGEGNVPNKKVIENLEKKGIPIKVISEPGAPGTMGKSSAEKQMTRAHAHLGTKMYPGGPSYGGALKRAYGRGFHGTTTRRTQVGKSKETWSGVPI